MIRSSMISESEDEFLNSTTCNFLNLSQVVWFLACELFLSELNWLGFFEKIKTNMNVLQEGHVQNLGGYFSFKLIRVICDCLATLEVIFIGGKFEILNEYYRPLSVINKFTSVKIFIALRYPSAIQLSGSRRK